MTDSSIQVYYNSEGYVMLELNGHGLELSRGEAEALFVDLGHCLTDMDVAAGLLDTEE